MPCPYGTESPSATALVEAGGGGVGTLGGGALRVTSPTLPATRANTRTTASPCAGREWRAAPPQVCSLPIDEPLESLRGRAPTAAEVRPYRLVSARGQQD